jgi:hypothetical protein
MGTVTIPVSGGTEFNIYGTQADADTYFTGSPNAAAWAALSADEAARLLVQATRLFERLLWDGEPAADPQVLAWPRTGLLDREGDTLSSDAVPTIVEEACYELALILNTSTDVLTSPTTGSNVKRLKAGSVEIENFRPTDTTSTRLPQIVHEMVGLWLRGSSDSARGYYYGADESRYTAPDPVDNKEDQADNSDFDFANV